MDAFDKVLFIMPEDREYQFPAMSALQSYVNGYTKRMEANRSHPEAIYGLEYNTTMSIEDWNFFTRIGTKLTCTPTDVLDYDVCMNFSKEQAMKFINSGKHVCQIMQIMCGVDCYPLLDIQRIKPRIDKFMWGMLSIDLLESIELPNVHLLTGDTLENIRDGGLTGVIGYAGWQTYLAACRGMAVVEIIPADRPKMWMSKFANKAYRCIIDTGNKEEVYRLVRQAIDNIEEMLTVALEQSKQKQEEHLCSAATASRELKEG